MTSAAVLILGLFILFSVVSKNREKMVSRSGLKEKKSPLRRLLTSCSGVDMLFRFLRFGLLFIASNMLDNSRFMFDHMRMLTIARANRLEKIANLFGLVRIASRLPRTRALCQDLLKVGQNTRQEKDKLQFTQMVLGWVGDLLNVAYFFIDHYLGLFVIGVLHNKSHLNSADFWGNYVWTWSSFFYFLRNLVMIWRYYQTRNFMNKEQAKNFKLLLAIDLSRNILDTILNYHYTYPTALQMRSISMMSVAAAGLWMTDFWKV